MTPLMFDNNITSSGDFLELDQSSLIMNYVPWPSKEMIIEWKEEYCLELQFHSIISSPAEKDSRDNHL